MPTPIDYNSHRKYVREVLAREVDLRANGTQIVPLEEESPASIAYRERINRNGSPSETVAAGYHYAPGTELARRVSVREEARAQ